MNLTLENKNTFTLSAESKNSALSLTPESKNAFTLTNEDKQSMARTWDESTFSWDDGGTWDIPGLVITKEAKNALSLSLETKNA